MKEPNNLAELHQFIGMVTYLSKFMPNLTIIPLHNLLKNDVPWYWSVTKQDAFRQVKKNITETPVSAYYNPSKTLVLKNSVCEYGLGSAIFQEGKTIVYASCSLSSAEQRYAHIEKEMLAVVYGLE